MRASSRFISFVTSPWMITSTCLFHRFGRWRSSHLIPIAAFFFASSKTKDEISASAWAAAFATCMANVSR